jgi:hypothetical protein
MGALEDREADLGAAAGGRDGGRRITKTAENTNLKTTAIRCR